MGKCRPGASRKVSPPHSQKCRPPNHGLKQSQAFQDAIIS